ncbi:hypothetical protein BO83DRAFT_170099 [Aspergillus eucalypticola CBS 122712]|uniref:Uncharacterized protein n=1 Tax=Aspergillus eucalypticola (strain CBS 122712 / IBT 29274) TaxID=1448314 RepID=A0A317WAJ6_ASPEC|nr:uncharacterized protein BO83DRAFT_170099 [Aspergillus eucalypticola CBS 122712]PWY81120.1 hypothetical protein BO83DRAFT_170099 [Aspergillus eucalypticola CBS 122712]
MSRHNQDIAFKCVGHDPDPTTEKESLERCWNLSYLTVDLEKDRQLFYELLRSYTVYNTRKRKLLPDIMFRVSQVGNLSVCLELDLRVQSLTPSTPVLFRTSVSTILPCGCPDTDPCLCSTVERLGA